MGDVEESGGGGSVSSGPLTERRTSTRQAKRRRVAAPESEQYEEDVADLAPKKKKPRRGPLAGRLAGLMEMPMDILFEIFGHLNPLDVLRLARTTKQFRRVLMDRSARCIWIAARNNLPDLPDCPPYMSEPQFANLVFDTHCHECLAPNTRSVDWRLTRRICMKCTKDCMVEEGYVYVAGSAYGAVPSKFGKRGRPCFYKKDLEEFQRRKASFTDPQEREEFVNECKARVQEMEKHGALLDGWAVRQANARSTELENLRGARKQAIIEELTKLGWGPEIEQIPSYDDLGNHRLVKQPTRLTPRIWSNIRPEMIKHMEDLRTRRLQRERRALVLSRKQLAISVLRTYKREHLPFTDIMPEPMDFCTFPAVSAIIELPTETAVTEASFTDVISQLDELIAQWRIRTHDSFIEKFKDALASKHRRTADALADEETNAEAKASTSSSTDVKGKGKAKAVEPPLPDKSELVKVLSLATTVFRCDNCTTNLWMIYDDPFQSFPSKYSASAVPLFYPKVMGHRCLTKGRVQESPTPEPISELRWYQQRMRTQWTCAHLRIDGQAEAIVSNIIVACDRDPLTTTTAEMDTLDPKLACLNCVQWDSMVKDSCKASVFGWRAAFVHSVQSHRDASGVKWKLLDENLVKDIENVDVNLPSPEPSLIATFMSAVLGTSLHSGTNEDSTWLCAHCMDLPEEKDSMILSKVKSHVSVAHGVDEPQENQDYYQDYEAPQGRRNPYTPNLKIALTMERPSIIAFPDDYMSDDSYDSYDGGCLCDACGDFHDEYDEYDDFPFFY